MNTRRVFGLALVGVLTAGCSGERLTGVAAEDAARRYQAETVAPGNEPLILVDGAERSMAEVRAMSAERIATIEVVKGAAAQSLYGDRGRLGVILITTRPKH